METLKQYAGQIFLAVCVITSISAFYYFVVRTPSTKVGDVWRYEIGDSDNPYENVKIYDYKVLDVRNGYVKMLNLQDSTIHVTEQSFLKFYELISSDGSIIIYVTKKN